MEAATGINPAVRPTAPLSAVSCDTVLAILADIADPEHRGFGILDRTGAQRRRTCVE